MQGFNDKEDFLKPLTVKKVTKLSKYEYSTFRQDVFLNSLFYMKSDQNLSFLPFHEDYESDLFINMSECVPNCEMEFQMRKNENFKKKSAAAIIDIFPRDLYGQQ